MIDIKLDLPIDKIIAFCRRHPIRRLSLFGSVLRDDFGPDSDVDVLVEFESDATVGYFELVAMQFELSDLVGQRVDLLTPAALSRYFRREVLNSSKLIYEKDSEI